jgi:hypothetical protein
MYSSWFSHAAVFKNTSEIRPVLRLLLKGGKKANTRSSHFNLNYWKKWKLPF